MFSEDVLWLFGSYLAGSAVTYILFWKATVIDVSTRTIDTLIDGGFLRHKRTEDGEIEILKWNESD
jgi:hypothetical protein|tara:strand:+ start:325 stop:522 length:198 start_codon:yes stop_codon:yes gene_type:complete